MERSTTFSAPFLLSPLPPDKKKLIPIIYFGLKSTYIDNKYDLYSRTFSDGSYMLEGVEFTVSYAPVAGIRSLSIILSISSSECLILFELNISNAFQKTILPNPVERVYLILPYIYLYWYKIKRQKYTLASSSQRELCIQAINSIQGTKPAGKLWYDLLKSIFITVKIIRLSSDHAVLSWVLKNKKSLLYVETYYILMTTENIICFERLTEYFDTLLDYTLQ